MVTTSVERRALSVEAWAGVPERSTLDARRSRTHVTLGVLLLLHGLAHAGAGMWAAGRVPPWLATPLWAAAMLGFLGGGFGALGIGPLSRYWLGLTLAGAAGSLGLLALVRHEAMLAGLLLDVGLVLLAARAAAVEPPGAADVRGRAASARHPALARAGRFAAWVLLAYVAALLVLRPWFMTWGTTAADRHEALPGDWLVPEARYRVDHAVIIRATADSVWPWLVQMGQDRGGFYSHEWLENLVGADLRNADRIVPAWQHREVGELVRAVPEDWLGGRFGRAIGWRIVEIEPGRAIVLDGWGAFVARPVDDSTTRLHVRTRGDGTPSVAATFLAPLGLLVFEPAHFIMERRMLLGIKERAEHRRRVGRAVP